MMDGKEVWARLCFLSSCRSEKKCQPTFSSTQSGNSNRQRGSPWITGICSITLKGNYFYFACQSTARVWRMIAGRLQQCSSILIRALGLWEASSVGHCKWSGTKPLPRNNVSRQDCVGQIVFGIASSFISSSHQGCICLIKTTVKLRNITI